MNDALGRPGRVLLLGGSSEIGLAIVNALNLAPDCEVLLAGRDKQRLAAAADQLPHHTRLHASLHIYDATAVETHEVFVDRLFTDADIDVVISAAGILTPQEHLDRHPLDAARLIDTNLTGHVTTLLAVAGRMRTQGHGTIVVLSSVAAVRPRKANYVYGAAKAGLDAFARGLADSLHGSGVRVLLVRPGFVVGRMTAGMTPAPLPTTPQQIATVIVKALTTGAETVWVPPSLRVLATLIPLVPRRIWRRIDF